MTASIDYWWRSSIYITEKAKELWLDVKIINENKNFFIVSWSDKSIIFKNTDFWANTALWKKIADDKELTWKMLEIWWFYSPKSIYFNSSKDFDANNIAVYTENFSYPLVIKPIDWAHWDWVCTNILDQEELLLKSENCLQEFWNLIIQEEHQWEEYRCFVYKWKVLWVYHRKPAFVVWDWKLSVKELIEFENNDPNRWIWYEKDLVNIEIDSELEDYIFKNWGFSLDSILDDWYELQLLWVSNIWKWWTLHDYTDIMCEELKNEIWRFAEYLWLWLAWVDLLSEDLSKPLWKWWWTILEINSTPGLSFRKDAEYILRDLFWL